MPINHIETATVAACNGVVGRCLVEQLLEAKARVVGFVRPGSENSVADILQKSEGRFSVLGGDLANPESSRKLVHEACEKLGSIQGHFHAAGSYEWTTWEKASPGTIDKLWTSNFTTAWTMGREIFQTMKKNGGGSLVFVSNRDTITMAGLGMGPYLAPKAALNMLVQSLASEGKSFGIRVNAVLPGIIDTEVNRKAMPDQDPKNWVNPGRLAGLMIDLAHPAREDVTGALVPVLGRMI